VIIEASQAAAISRDSDGDYHVHTNYDGAATGAGAMWGGFWGLLFFIPFAGLEIGAGMGALFGHFGEKGIDKHFQEQVREHLKPGTSALALFMIIEQVTEDKAVAALEKYGGTVMRTSLSERTRSVSRKLCNRPRRLRPPPRRDRMRDPGCRPPPAGSPARRAMTARCAGPRGLVGAGASARWGRDANRGLSRLGASVASWALVDPLGGNVGRT